MSGFNYGLLTSVAVGACLWLAFPGQAVAGCSGECTETESETATKTTTQTNTQTTIRGVQRGVQKSVASTIGRSIRGRRQTEAEGDRFVHSGTGLSGGDLPESLSTWGSVSFINTNLDPTTTRYEQDSDVLNLQVGADIAPLDSLILGLSAGLSWSDTYGDHADTAAKFEQTSRSLTLAPYAAYIVNENFYMDGTLGYTDSQIDYHAVGAGGATTNEVNDRNSKTFFGSLGGSYLYTWQDVDFTGRLGYSWSRTRTEAKVNQLGGTIAGSSFVDSQISAGVQAARWLGEVHGSWPMGLVGGLTYEHYKETSEAGDEGWRVELGADFAVTDATTFSILGEGLLGRSSQEEAGITLNLNTAF